jgi:hypothetical protein
MSRPGTVAAAAIFILSAGSSIFAQDTRASDAAERYRIKYGRYPPRTEAKEWDIAEEWRKRSDRLFKRLDIDRNGSISEHEWSEAEVLFSRIDPNRDGRISAAEITAAHAERFGSVDSNGDRRISKAEWKVKPKGTLASPSGGF